MTKTNHILLATAVSILLQCQLCALGQGAPDGTQIAITSSTGSVTALQQAREEARALFMASQFEQAVNKWAAICRSGGASHDYYWLGESYYHLGKLVEAAQSFEFALQKGPVLELLYSRLAETYFALKQHDHVQSTCSNGLGVVRDPSIRAQLEVYLKLAGKPLPVPQRTKEEGRGRHPANG